MRKILILVFLAISTACFCDQLTSKAGLIFTFPGGLTLKKVSERVVLSNRGAIVEQNFAMTYKGKVFPVFTSFAFTDDRTVKDVAVLTKKYGISLVMTLNDFPFPGSDGFARDKFPQFYSSATDDSANGFGKYLAWTSTDYLSDVVEYTISVRERGLVFSITIANIWKQLSGKPNMDISLESVNIFPDRLNGAILLYSILDKVVKNAVKKVA